MCDARSARLPPWRARPAANSRESARPRQRLAVFRAHTPPTSQEVAGRRQKAIFYGFYSFLVRGPVFHVSFAKQNVEIGEGRWLFENGSQDRIEWIALLAYYRISQPPGDGSVSLDQIERLPEWSGKTRKHIGGNLARYFQGLHPIKAGIVEPISIRRGPFRLTVEPSEVSFDRPLDEVEGILRISPSRPEVQQDDLARFVPKFVRAEVLLQQGKLISTSSKNTVSGAHALLAELERSFPANPRLRLIATLAIVRVQFRMGRFGAARKSLLECEGLVTRASDPFLEAQYHLSLAWSYQREQSSTETNETVETHLSKARECALRSGDRSCLGLLAYREAWFLAKKKKYKAALVQMSLAVEDGMITSNFTALQAYCADLGSISHRTGLRNYKNARRWLLTGVLIARWTQLGRDDAHGEMILGKMYSEMGNRGLTAALWLSRAERIAKSAGNVVNLADVHMVRAFWYRQYGARKDLIETLAIALKEFRSLSGFDSRQKEKYMMLEFPSVWLQVLAFARGHKSDSF